MKTYLIFKNEPRSRMYEFEAKSKHDALKQYNEKTGQKYKITSDHCAMLWIVEKKAWYRYNFRAISYATQLPA